MIISLQAEPLYLQAINLNKQDPNVKTFLTPRTLIVQQTDGTAYEYSLQFLASNQINSYDKEFNTYGRYKYLSASTMSPNGLWLVLCTDSGNDNDLGVMIYRAG